MKLHVTAAFWSQNCPVGDADKGTLPIQVKRVWVSQTGRPHNLEGNAMLFEPPYFAQPWSPLPRLSISRRSSPDQWTFSNVSLVNLTMTDRVRRAALLDHQQGDSADPNLHPRDSSDAQRSDLRIHDLFPGGIISVCVQMHATGPGRSG